MYTKIHMYNVFYMKCPVLLVFSCVSLCFYCKNINYWYISHEFTKIYIYHIFYMKCTVLQVFSCVFTVFSLQKHVFLIHINCIPKYTCNINSTWNAQFSSVFMWFHCVSSAETGIFGTFHMNLPKEPCTIYSS
jgi:hypothetical protein